MLHVLQRIVCPLLLLAAGIGSLVYGTWFHREKIWTEQEIEIEIPAPPPEASPFAPGGPGGFGDPDAPPGFGGPEGFDGPSGPEGFGGPEEGMPGEFDEPPPGLPPELKPKAKTITELIVHETHELEGIIIKEITTGGLTLNDADELQRTYLFGEKPDSLCPT